MDVLGIRATNATSRSATRSAARPGPFRTARQPRFGRIIGNAIFAAEGTLALSSGYLLLLLYAARGAARTPANVETCDSSLQLVVLMPAHDEEVGIEATLTSLAACTYPGDARRTIVIADNCTDRTVELARIAGVEVWERTDPTKLGKGFALAWAFGRLDEEGLAFDAAVVLDADCHPSANMLSAMSARMQQGANAVQVSYLVSNPDASYASALRYAAFSLMNTVRPLGKHQLGLSCGLLGTGMAFTKGLLERVPWSVSGLVEDSEHHMRVVEAGERVEFIPYACVSSAMPTSLSASASQQARWEGGKLHLIRRWTPRLVGSGLAKRDIERVHVGLEPLVLPQSLIAAGSVASAVAGMVFGSKRLAGLSVAALAGQLTFVLMGLRLVQAPVLVYRALLAAPALIAQKVILYIGLLGGQRPTSWVRTEREPAVID
jgi:1,2-diacylglycerol 3-beta-glucosyltransferase